MRGETRVRQGHGTVRVRLLVSRNPLTMFWIHCLSLYGGPGAARTSSPQASGFLLRLLIGARIAPAGITVKTTQPGTYEVEAAVCPAAAYAGSP